ncbi:MAG: rhomboid family intramembrane serine protease [Chitinophagales bacterium]|nr:rhomboid family intramembrane serine protease [Chitinophagales bacterium]
MLQSIVNDIKWQSKYGSPTIKLILINIGIFIIINLLILVDFLMKGPNLGLLAIKNLSLHTGSALLKKPWGIFTYMFVQADFFHLLFNMLVFYWFSSYITNLLGNKKIVPIYILGGLFGALFFIVGTYLLSNNYPKMINNYAIGASASVMAIVLSAATLSPDAEMRLLFLGNIKLKWIAAVYVFLDITMISSSNSGGHIAHLGGALFGFIYIKQLQNGNDWSLWFYSIIDKVKSLFSKEKNIKVEYINKDKEKPKSKQQDIDKQQHLDEILDKIKLSGYDSLSKAEKDFLFKISKED